VELSHSRGNARRGPYDEIVRTRQHSPWLRPGLGLLAVQAGLVGIWALAAPRSFFADFPVWGGAWVAALPPYNEHLIRDVGGLYTAFTVLFLWAAVGLDETLVRASLVSWLPFAALHFYFHVTHSESLEFSQAVLQNALLAAVALIPIGLLSTMRKKRRAASFRPMR
jgi:hypothetical protein